MWNKIERVVEWCIFQSRWLQVPVYLGMCIVMGMYSFVFCKEVVHTLMNVGVFSEEAMLMLAIGVVDVSMVLNLIIVCVIGGFGLLLVNWKSLRKIKIIISLVTLGR